MKLRYLLTPLFTLFFVVPAYSGEIVTVILYDNDQCFSVGKSSFLIYEDEERQKKVCAKQSNRIYYKSYKLNDHCVNFSGSSSTTQDICRWVSAVD